MIKGQICGLLKYLVGMNFTFTWCGDWQDPAAIPPALNRSFLYGDGFFESMRFGPDGRCLLWNYHADRLQRSMEFLGFPPWPGKTEDFLAARIAEVFPAGGQSDWRVKMVVFRVGEGRYEPRSARSAFYLEIKPAGPAVQKINGTGTSQRVWVQPGPGSWIKSTSALVYVLAAREKEEKGLEEMILCDAEGYAVEGCHSALFWKYGDALFFPDPELGGLDSCFRRFFQDRCRQAGKPFYVRRATARDVLDAHGIGFGNGMGVKLVENSPGIWNDWLTGTGFGFS